MHLRSYWAGNVIERVYLWGETDSEDDKLAAEHRASLFLIQPEQVRHAYLSWGCWCAEQALLGERAAGWEPDPRSWAAITALQEYLAGRATIEVIRAAARAADAAADAAYAAADAAAYAAYAAADAAYAAYAAADAAADAAARAARAARAAAYAAADAAYAADAAADAAARAARAARAAAYAAADAAYAADAAADAADAAVQERQRTKLTDLLMACAPAGYSEVL
jgi:hypothetical protein